MESFKLFDSIECKEIIKTLEDRYEWKYFSREYASGNSSYYKIEVNDHFGSMIELKNGLIKN